MLAQAAALDQADAIRGYVERVLVRSRELGLIPQDIEKWAAWARGEADRVDPVRNGTIGKAIRDISEAE